MRCQWSRLTRPLCTDTMPKHSQEPGLSGPPPVLVRRSSSRQSPRAAADAHQPPLTHIVGGRPLGNAEAYVGPEAEMPNADKFILCKKFEFTYEEHATMSAGRVQWTETNTFVQATKWVYDTAAPGPSQEKPAAKSSEVPSVAVPSPAQFQKTIKRYTNEIKKGKGVDIYLVYGYGNNVAPPQGGRPLLFDAWEGAVEEKGAQFYAEKHGKTYFKKFRALDGHSATEWVEFYIRGADEYIKKHGAARPQWYTEPVDYPKPSLKFSLFSVAVSPVEEGSVRSALECAQPGAVATSAPPACRAIMWNQQTAFLATVPDQPEKPCRAQDATNASASAVKLEPVDSMPTSEQGEAAPVEEERVGAKSDEGSKEGSVTPPHPPSSILKKDDAGQAGAEEGKGASAGAAPKKAVSIAGADEESETKAGCSKGEPPQDPFLANSLCVGCGDVVEAEGGEHFLFCNKGMLGGDGVKHWCHVDCFPKGVSAKSVPCKSIIAETKTERGFSDMEVPPALLGCMTCSFTTLKYNMKVALIAEEKETADTNAKLNQIRAQMQLKELENRNLRLASTLGAASTSGATGAAAPVPVPAVEKEVVVMTYQGLPFDPRWTRIQRDEAASKFRAIQHTTGIQTEAVWLGQARTGGAVPLHVILGAAEDEAGNPNEAVLQNAILLLATQALDAYDSTETVWLSPG